MRINLLTIWPYISVAFLAALVVSIIYYPSISGRFSSILLLLSLGIAVLFIVQKYLQPYKQGQITRFKLARNITLDLLGLLLTILAASYLGGIAGTWASQYGLWTGLVVGIIVGFLSALGVRKMWSRIFTRLVPSAA